MFYWISMPMVRVTAFFIAGILTASYFPLSLSVVTWVIVAFSCCGIYVLFMQYGVDNSYMGAVGLLIVFMLGYSIYMGNREEDRPDHLVHRKEKSLAFIGKVSSYPEQRLSKQRMTLEIEQVWSQQQWIRARGKVLVYVTGRGDTTWKYGDRLLVKGVLNRVTPPLNPRAFDNQKYLSRLGVFHRCYVDQSSIYRLDGAYRRGFIYYAHEIRRWASERIGRYVVGIDEQAILHALLLGIKGSIDHELRQSFAAGGVMHMLSVSGLHVGILYATLLLLLRLFKWIRWYRWIEVFVSILVLWSFAFVSGLSPSVLRAVTMFSFLICARTLAWKTNVYNTLASSAFILLLFNPNFLFSIGFQLSYLAVWGIVYFYRPMYRLWVIKNGIGNKIWQIVCVSISAQMSTSLLSILYFHQFPVYFLLANIAFIPIVTTLLIMGLVLLGVSWWHGLAVYVGLGVTWGSKILIEGVRFIEHLPFSVIDRVHFTVTECLCLSALFVSLLILWQVKNIRWLYVAFGCAFLFGVFRWHFYFTEIRSSSFIVYRSYRYGVVEWSRDGYAIEYISEGFGNEPSVSPVLYVQGNRIYRGIRRIDNLNHRTELYEKINAFRVCVWKDKMIGLLDSDSLYTSTWPGLDYLVISRNALRRFEDIRINGSPTVILDGSNTLSYQSRLISFCKRNKIAYHAVMKQGAFILNL